jgi:hypothetical protein
MIERTPVCNKISGRGSHTGSQTTTCMRSIDSRNRMRHRVPRAESIHTFSAAGSDRGHTGGAVSCRQAPERPAGRCWERLCSVTCWHRRRWLCFSSQHSSSCFRAWTNGGGAGGTRKPVLPHMIVKAPIRLSTARSLCADCASGRGMPA